MVSEASSTLYIPLLSCRIYSSFVTPTSASYFGILTLCCESYNLYSLRLSSGGLKYHEYNVSLQYPLRTGTSLPSVVRVYRAVHASLCTHLYLRHCYVGSSNSRFFVVHIFRPPGQTRKERTFAFCDPRMKYMYNCTNK